MSDTLSATAPLSVDVVWARLSGQLSALADTTRVLEDAAAPHPPEAVTEEMIKTLQSFDYLGQALDDLAVLTGELGRCNNLGALAPADVQSVTTKLRLAASKGLLARSGPEARASAQTTAPGEATLF